MNPDVEIENNEQGECYYDSKIKTVLSKLTGASKIKIAEIFSNSRVVL
jgi:hypothetical protein